MMLKFKKYFFLFFLALMMIAGIIVYQTWNKPHRDIKDAKALVVPATELYKNLANGSSPNKSIYINKIVAVSGEIKEVMKNEKNQQVLLLKTTVPGGYVNCTMEENIHNPKNGENVLVKGICSGYIGADLGLPGDVFLIRCYPTS